MIELEFYSYDDEVWCRYLDGHTEMLVEQNYDFINMLFEKIKNDFPESFECLQKEYGDRKFNLPYYKYVVVKRFIKCNFSKMDSTYNDIDRYNLKSIINFERVDCPMRGECKYENKLCMPRQSSSLSSREMMVAKLLYQGKNKEEIAKEMFLSFDTINNHVNNIYKKFGVHNEADFVRYIISKKLF